MTSTAAEMASDLLVPFLLIAAPLIGSFLALVADRAATGADPLAGRSRCDGCGRVLSPFELVPLASYLMLGGRSRCCGIRLRAFLPLAELAALGVVAWAAIAMPRHLLPVSVGLGWVLLALALVDLRTFRLPDWGTLPLVLAGLALAAAGWTGPLLEHALGALIGYGALAGIAAAYRHLRGVDGLGLGDAKLLAAAGAWLGPLALPSVVLTAALVGLLQAVLLQDRTAGLSARMALPFGPALAFGFWLGWSHGPLLLR